MKKTINVTKRDIEKYVNAINAKTMQDSCSECAIATAIKRKFKPTEYVRVGYHLLSFDGKFLWLPEIVRNNIRSMTQGNTVPPFSFELEIA